MMTIEHEKFIQMISKQLEDYIESADDFLNYDDLETATEPASNEDRLIHLILHQQKQIKELQYSLNIHSHRNGLA